MSDNDRDNQYTQPPPVIPPRPTFNEADYDITPEYTERWDNGSAERGSEPIFKEWLTRRPGVLNRGAWERDTQLNGIQDPDFEYDKYIYDKWSEPTNYPLKGVVSGGGGVYQEQVESILNTHRNDWTQRQADREKKQGLMAEKPPEFSYTVSKTQVRSDMSNLDLTKEGEGGLSVLEPLGEVLKGMTQVTDKTL